MRILVAGGAGFLGSHLVELLLNHGHDVTIVDNLATGSLGNIEHLRGRNSLRFTEHNILQPVDGGYDWIFNLACPASPPQYQKNPIDTAKINFTGVDNLLQLATQCGARFFQASTSEVYGDPTIDPQREDYRGNVNPIGPRACYDEGKRIAETLCFDYRRQLNTRVKVARIFNTYGPRMAADDGRVVSNFVVQALQDKPLTIYGSGEQTRSFCYVDDLIDGIVRLMESGDDVTGPINLGNPHEFTVQELADTVIELTGSHSKLEHYPLPTDDPQQRRPDISLAEKTLDWHPRVQLKEGLTKTIQYFRDVLST